MIVVVASLYCLLLVTLTSWKPDAGALFQSCPGTIILLCITAGAVSQTFTESDHSFRITLRACFFYSVATMLFAGAWLAMAEVGCQSLGSRSGKGVSLAAAFLLWLAVVLAFLRHGSL